MVNRALIVGLLFGLICAVVVTIAIIVALVAISAHTTVEDVTFSSTFFDQIRREEGNLLFSPLSMELLLAVVHAGAGGSTATQIQQAVKLPERRAEFFGYLRESFQRDGNITLRFADEILAGTDFTFNQEFLDFLADCSDAYAFPGNFRKTPEAENVNNLVTVSTEYGITEQFREGMNFPRTALRMLNTMYFKGDWLVEFSESSTQKRIFYVNDNEKKEVDFMQTENYFKYGWIEDLDAQIVEIPFKENKVSMILVVPNPINGLFNLESKINDFDWNEWSNRSQKEKVILTMPKFKLGQRIQLKKFLRSVGISDLFSEGKSNLSGIGDKPLFSWWATQSTSIEVNEKGTGAATAAAVQEDPNSLLPYDVLSYKVTADRPFLFFLNHKPTGLHFLMGRLASPSRYPVFDYVLS